MLGKDWTFGNYWKQTDGSRYVHHVASVLRLVGTAYEIARRNHCDRSIAEGWYLDSDFQDETACGVVVQLPARNGKPQFLAGYQTTQDTNQGATVYFDEIFDDEMEAARRADRHAEIAAEKERDYQAAARAGMEFNDIAETISATRQRALRLCRELRQARIAFPSLGDAHGLCAVIREKIAEQVDAIREMRARRRQLENDFGSTEGFKNA